MEEERFHRRQDTRLEKVRGTTAAQTGDVVRIDALVSLCQDSCRHLVRWTAEETHLQSKFVGERLIVVTVLLGSLGAGEKGDPALFLGRRNQVRPLRLERGV